MYEKEAIEEAKQRIAEHKEVIKYEKKRPGGAAIEAHLEWRIKLLKDEIRELEA